MSGEARFLSITDAARRLAVNRTRMYELVAQGRVPAVRLGEHGTIRIPVAWLECVEREAMQSRWYANGEAAPREWVSAQWQ